NTRLAQIGWRMARQVAEAQTGDAQFDPRDPRHVGGFGAYLASPDAGWISGQTFQVRGGVVEDIDTWAVRDTARPDGRAFPAAEEHENDRQDDQESGRKHLRKHACGVPSIRRVRSSLVSAW